MDIYHFTYNHGEASIHNPYLEEIEILKSRVHGPRELYNYREELVSRYAFAIPTMEVLQMIAGYSPIVEIGAGNGYWAYCLSQLGADVIAFDASPPGDKLPWPHGELNDENPWFTENWFAVSDGDHAMATLNPHRALFLCWPVFNNPMAYGSLQHYRNAGGKTVIFIGDRHGSGDENFFHELDRCLQICTMETWSWHGIHETLEIYDITLRR